jgi:ATP-binding cassette subfamily C (CFTR/MRP) protein 1
MYAPMKFFESQPIGRILNRFSSDISSVDQKIWILMLVVVLSIAQLFQASAILVYTDFRLLLLIVPLFIIYFLAIMLYQRSNVEFKRYSITLNSSLYAHISESLSGITTIKAYSSEKFFVEKELKLINDANSAIFLNCSASVWMNLRLELFSSVIFITLCTLAFFQKTNASLIGLAISYALQFTQHFAIVLFGASELDSELSSVERLLVYCHDLPQEAASKNDNDPDLKSWPVAAQLEFKNVQLSYPTRPDYQVLKGLTLNIKAGEKVGIVGRTGSGKSTILLAILRILELDMGSITIDGIDISSIGLYTLRKRLQIIPQDPILFSGSIRQNLDLEEEHTDKQIWEALKTVGLSDFVSSLDAKLDGVVEEGGSNLSVGQRQLICLARAILAKPKLLLMDEATASVDFEVDRMIQASIKTNFADTTVLCIAHRIKTIADFDRILVLSNGIAEDFDTPNSLLERKGLFAELMKASQ